MSSLSMGVREAADDDKGDDQEEEEEAMGAVRWFKLV